MTLATHKNGHPVSVKGIVLVERRVLLLRNDRDQWELPGGRPDVGETWPRTLARELREEANIEAIVGPLVAEWPYEVLPGRRVWIVAFGCRATRTDAPRVSPEHRALHFHRLAELDDLALDDGYRAAIDSWYAIERQAPPFSESSS